MPETRKPVSLRGAVTRALARLRNSSLANRSIAILSTMMTMLVAAARRGGAWLRHHGATAYRASAPRIATGFEQLRQSPPVTKAAAFGGKAATMARNQYGTARDSAFGRQVAQRTDHAITVVKQSPAGQLAGNGIAKVRQHMPEWAVARAGGKSAWRVAVADSGAAFLWRAVAGVAVIAIASVFLMGSPFGGSSTSDTAGLPAERSVEDAAGRSDTRGDDPEAPQPGEPEESAPAEPETETEATEEPPAEPQPVGGLNKDQMANAVEIVRIGQDMGISERGQAVALVTAMQESQLLVLANTGLPESLDVPNQGTGYDHDSVGLFQQRPSSGWGTVEECMDVEYSTTVFYKSLERIKGWEKLDLTVAAQSVQISAFPDHYAKWEGLAWDIIDEVNK